METQGHPARSLRVAAALAGLAIAGVVGASLVAGHAPAFDGGRPPASPRPARRLEKLEPWTKSQCQTYPWLKFVKPLYKHLGSKGARLGDGDGEGLVYRTLGMGTGAGSEQGKSVLLILNATNADYRPFSPRLNGMHGGFYGSLNLRSGSHLDLKMSFRDEQTGKPLRMERLALTFFDLDAGHKGRSTESVAVNRFKQHYVTGGTEVRTSDEGGGMTKFTASTYGDGDDNPKDPMLLTAQQRNRAVTLLFEDVSEIDVTLGATKNPNKSPRFFTFVLRPSLLCAVTLTKGLKKPLPALDYDPPLEFPVPVEEGMRFERWLAKVGDSVKGGDAIAAVKDKDGTERKLRAPQQGTVKAEAALEPGESCDTRLTDTTIAVIEVDRLPALEAADDGDKAAVAEDGETFVKFAKGVGEVVRKGDAIAVVTDDKGDEVEVKAPKTGLIDAEQTKMQKGDPIERVEDKNLATLARFPALVTGDGDAATNAPKGARFVRYVKKPEEVVALGTVVATVRNADGDEEPVKATRAGVIRSELDKLEEGMAIDEVMTDHNLATIGKLPPLQVSAGEAPANAPKGEWRFKQWKARVGDELREGDAVAVVEDGRGTRKTVKAPKPGAVVEREKYLRQGDRIDEVMKGQDLAVIGKVKELKVEGWRMVGVSFPEGAVFRDWKVSKGDHVSQGDPIAEVELPGRRLADGRMLSGVTTIPSPASGTVAQEQPLKAGQSIADQQLGPTIATIDMGLPWWLWLLVALLALLGILACVACPLLMRKPKQEFAPIPPAEEAPVPEPQPKVEEPPKVVEPPPPEPVEAKPEGLRLDFDDEGTTRTVYARYRPLGILHNNTAPIVVHDFTFNSYAKLELGLKDGWKLKRIADEELHDNPDFAEVNSKLLHYMKDFPLWPLPLGFKDSSGARREMKFVDRPIGLEFSNRAPIKVSRVHRGSPAQAQGVQEGWDVVSIGEVDVAENHNFREIMGYFKEGAQPLDDHGRAYP